MSTAKRTILHVLAPAETGGLESVVAALSRGQAQRGHRVLVASVVPPGGATPTCFRDLSDAGVTHVRLTVPTRSYLRERREVVALGRDVGADVAHTHGYRPDLVDGGPLRAAGVPTVTTVHGFIGGTARARLYERLQVRAFRRFDAVVAVSRALRDLLVSRGVPARRVRLIANAWASRSRPPDAAAARYRLGVADGTFHIGFVGRLGREKGADLLIEAIARMADVGRPVRVSMIGSGAERAVLEERAAELGIAGQVAWHGTQPDAAELFAGFDAFVLSSRSEGTPIVLLEAMAAGAPIIATAVGGVPDVVDESTAVLVPSGDVDALARAIASVARDGVGAGERVREARRVLGARHAASPWLDAYDAIYAEITGTTKA